MIESSIEKKSNSKNLNEWLRRWYDQVGFNILSRKKEEEREGVSKVWPFCIS